MRIGQNLIVAASAVLWSSAVAQCGFTVTAVANGLPVSGRQRIDLIAFNDGFGGTGTKLQAVDLTYSAPSGTRAYFGVQDLLPSDEDGNPIPDGIYDSVNLYNNPSVLPLTSQFRFSSAPGATTISNPAASDHTYQDFSPSTAQNSAGTPYVGGLTSFRGAYAILGTTAPIANGTGGGAAAGASFARLYVDAGPTFTVTGTIAGDQGSAVPFTVEVGEPPDNHPPVVISPAPQTVTFGEDVTNGVPFSDTVTATDVDATDVLSLAIGTLPAGVDNITVTGGGPGPQLFTVTGRLAYSTNKTQVVIPFTVTDGLNVVPGSIVLDVVPEPSTVLVGMAALGAMARRWRV